MQKIAIVFLMFLFLFPPPLYSQEGKSTKGPRRQVATIIFAGLGGAVLGLSTLSFYDRPQDKLSNIAIGFGAGIIIGAVFMTYQAASQPEKYYKTSNNLDNRTQPQAKWIQTNLNLSEMNVWGANYSFKF